MAADRHMESTRDTPYGAARVSAQRAAIAAAVERMPGAFTVSQLANEVGASSGGAGIATVYRAVAAMVESGHLEHVGKRGGHALYVRCEEGAHHHHLVCTSCGSIAEAPCPLDAPALRQATPAGFVITRHELEIYGLCGRCATGRTGGSTARGAGG